MKKKIIGASSVVIILLVAAVFIGFRVGSPYQDGVYKAIAAEIPASGWQETVEINVEKGKITKVNWDAIYKDDSIPIRKKQYSKSGLYGMMAGGASNEWYDQAVAAERFILDKGIEALDISPEGYTDAVTGCTINVGELQRLYLQCIEAAHK